MLCVLVLPYSNWQWATVCLSESMVALRKGVQRALFQLGRVPEWHQTDNSTAATHRIADDLVARVDGSKRPFNIEYVALMAHLGMKPRTIGIGESEQNGDVEAANGVIKRAARAGAVASRKPRLRQRCGMAVLRRRGRPESA